MKTPEQMAEEYAKARDEAALEDVKLSPTPIYDAWRRGADWGYHAALNSEAVKILVKSLMYYANHADIVTPGPIKVIHRGSVSTIESNGEAIIHGICGVAREALAQFEALTKEVGER